MSRFEHIGGKTVSFVFDERVATIYAICPSVGEPPIYVGSTTQSLRLRIRAHLLDAAKGSGIPIHQWMRDHEQFAVEVLESVPEARRHAAEIEWIASFKNLLNLTDGGAGCSGYRWPGDQRERVAARLRRGAHFNCARCGSQFWRKPRDIAKGDCKYCSRACSNRRNLREASRHA